jgi:diadenosine tetraphosphate (Ap4A) HIT family hydrolase
MTRWKKLLFLFCVLGFGIWIASYFDFRKLPACAFCEQEVLNAQEFDRENGIIALLTYKPVATGHVLIIPERHVENFEDLTDLEIAYMGKMIKKVDKVIKTRYGNTGYLLLSKNGKSAGATVPHLHIHYLPRYPKESHLFFALRFWFLPLLHPISKVEIAKELAFLHSAMHSSSKKQYR